MGKIIFVCLLLGIYSTAAEESNSPLDELSPSDRGEEAIPPPTRADFVTVNGIGINYIFPYFQSLWRVGEGFAVGGQFLYMNYPLSNGSLKGWGWLLGMHYFGTTTFHGLWAELSVGTYKLTGEESGVEESKTPLALTGTLGWRWLWDSGLSMGFGVGFNAFFGTRFQNLNLDFSGLLPAILMDVGFAI